MSGTNDFGPFCGNHSVYLTFLNRMGVSSVYIDARNLLIQSSTYGTGLGAKHEFFFGGGAVDPASSPRCSYVPARVPQLKNEVHLDQPNWSSSIEHHRCHRVIMSHGEASRQPLRHCPPAFKNTVTPPIPYPPVR